MEPYYSDASIQVLHGDCLQVLPTLPDNSVDAVVTDPPYGLEFMGKDWDSFRQSNRGPQNMAFKDFGAMPSFSPNRRNQKCPQCNRWAYDHPGRKCECGGWKQPAQKGYSVAFQTWCEQWAAECLRILKPGGHLLAFGGTRTSHRLACAVEDAGFEIRDSIAWLYGSGFPKSLDVSKAIDRLNGKPLDRLRDFGAYMRATRQSRGLSQTQVDRELGMSHACHWWEGEGAGEHWDLHPPSRETWARIKALYGIAGEWDWLIEWAAAERTVLGVADDRGRTQTFGGSESRPADITAPATPEAEQWQGWGTALKPAHEPIIVARKPLVGTVAANVLRWGTGALNIAAGRIHTAGSEAKAYTVKRTAPGATQNATGRTKFDDGTMYEGETTAGRWPANVALDESQADALDQQSGERRGFTSQNDNTAQTDGFDGWGSWGKLQPGRRQGFDDDPGGGASRFYFTAKASSDERITHNGVAHATVKPLSLMRWLVRLVCPPGGTILEPFAGSGTTVEAAFLEGFRCIAIEREADYLPLITQRISRRRDPIAYITAAGEDLGLFGEDTA